MQQFPKSLRSLLGPRLRNLSQQKLALRLSFNPAATHDGVIYEALRELTHSNKRFREFLGMPARRGRGRLPVYLTEHRPAKNGFTTTSYGTRTQRYRKPDLSAQPQDFVDPHSLFGWWTAKLPVEQGGGDAWRDLRALEAVRVWDAGVRAAVRDAKEARRQAVEDRKRALQEHTERSLVATHQNLVDAHLAALNWGEAGAVRDGRPRRRMLSPMAAKLRARRDARNA